MTQRAKYVVATLLKGHALYDHYSLSSPTSQSSHQSGLKFPTILSAIQRWLAQNQRVMHFLWVGIYSSCMERLLKMGLGELLS